VLRELDVVLQLRPGHVWLALLAAHSSCRG
jgi:hypothetical protein